MRNVLLATALIAGFMVSASTAQAQTVAGTYSVRTADGMVHTRLIGDVKAFSPKYVLTADSRLAAVRTHTYHKGLGLNVALGDMRSLALKHRGSSNAKADRELGLTK